MNTENDDTVADQGVEVSFLDRSWVGELRERNRRRTHAVSPFILSLMMSSAFAASLFLAYFAPLSQSLPSMIFTAFFIFFVIVLGVVDAQIRRLPNVLVLMLAALGVIGVVLGYLDAIHAVSGFLFGLIVPLLVTGMYVLMQKMGKRFLAPYEKSPSPSGDAGEPSAAASSGPSGAASQSASPLGAGDVKYLAVLGLFMGGHMVSVLFIACIFGLLGLTMRNFLLRKSDNTFPFGPYMSLAVVICLMFLW